MQFTASLPDHPGQIRAGIQRSSSLEIERGSLEKKIIKGKGIRSLGSREIAPCKRISKRKTVFLKRAAGQVC